MATVWLFKLVCFQKQRTGRLNFYGEFYNVQSRYGKNDCVLSSADRFVKTFEAPKESALSNASTPGSSKNGGVMEAVYYFKGNYGFLSNFYLTPVNGYPSSENNYQAEKTTDEKIKAEFRNPLMTSAMAKRYGRTLKIRPDWDEIKDQVMLEIVREKFRNSRLQSLLLQTSTKYLFEGNNWHDVYWGVCDGRHANYSEAPAHPDLSIGENKLGKILERVRFEIWTKDSF
jgi:ribA/ribD-fused uncharacterized protein